MHMCFRKKAGKVLDSVVHVLLRKLESMSHSTYHLVDVEGVVLEGFGRCFHSPVGVEVDV